MKIDESDSVKAARERMEASRQSASNMGGIDTAGLRATIIDFFGMILWLALALGMLSVVWQIVTFSWVDALTTFVQTIAVVGLGFVALDIRERLIRK